MNIIKTLITLYEESYKKFERQEETTRVVLNIEEFSKLSINVTLCEQNDSVNILFVKDTGPGFSHSELRHALTGQTSTNSSVLDFFKFSALKIAQHTFIITHTQLQSAGKVDNMVHIGFLSAKFIKDSGAD